MSPPPRGPLATVDVIAEMPDGGIVLVRRKYPPPGWALPGGFVEAGESAAAAARRELLEETGLDGGRLPALILHGARDTLIDPREAAVTLAVLGGADKALVMVPDRGHNDIATGELYWPALADFIARVT